jgi:hypothetical protein
VDTEVRRAVLAVSNRWVPLPAGTSGDPNTIDVFWLACLLEQAGQIRLPATLPAKPIGIAIVELVETAFIKGLIRNVPATSLADQAVALSGRLQEAQLLDGLPLTNLVVALSTWHGCICMAKDLRKVAVGGMVYTPEIRTAGYQFLKETWEAAEKRGNPWVRYGVSLAKEFERQRGNTVTDEWVPKESPYWSGD